MKFLCKTAELLQALQLASRAISGQQALPILGNVHMEARAGLCTVSATDLELSIVTSFPAEVEADGVITVPAKALLNFAQYNTDTDVSIELTQGTQLLCKSAHGKTSIAGESAKDYPSIAPIEKKTALSLKSAELIEVLNLVTFTSAKSTLRPVLSGVSIRSRDGKIIFVATDSYRLSEYAMIAEDVPADLSCIVPVKVLQELSSAVGNAKGNKKGEDGNAAEAVDRVSMVLGAQQVEFTVGRTRLLSRLIEGKFPDYQQIIPKGEGTRSTIFIGDLTTAVKRMHYFAKEVNNNLTFKIGEGAAHIATPQTPIGRDESTVPAEVTGGETKIALSSSYLLDFLGHISADSIEMRVTDGMHPAVFKIPGNDQFLHLIMPLRLQEN
jgi:DNA polymerase III subunit beta